MPENFDRILDECIDRSQRGERRESILADYPQYADRLKPLLTAMAGTQQAYAFTPSAEAKRAGRQRLLAAMEKSRQPSFWQRLFEHRTMWASLAAVLVIAIIGGYFGLRTGFLPNNNPTNIVDLPTNSPTSVPTDEPTYTPTNEPTEVPENLPVELIASANVNGNFVFLVSDEVNAIDEFSSLNVTLDKVGLLQTGESEKWLEFVPEVKTFDLTQLPGDVTQQLWQGDVPDGQYSRARLYIAEVTGTLKNGTEVEIKVPSNKLDLTLPAFQIKADTVTSFTYDITVLNVGSGQGEDSYHIKPQASESGVSQKNSTSQDKSKGSKGPTDPDNSTSTPVNNNRKNNTSL